MLRRLSILGTLIRLPNLLILAAAVTIYCFWVLYPCLIRAHLSPSLSIKDYALLIFIIFCTGAGGYIHNDILDLRSDEINKKRAIVGKQISITLASVYYLFMVIAPIPMVYSLSIEIDNRAYILAYLAVVLVLYIYNRYLKRLPLIGNAVVALLCVSVFVLPAIIEVRQLRLMQIQYPEVHYYCFSITVSYAVFIFLTHLIREIVKDGEDMKGDIHVQYKTLPAIVSSRSLTVVLILLQLTLLSMILWWIFGWAFRYSYGYIHFLLLVPLTVWIIYLTVRSDDKKGYALLSRHLKYLLLAGIISLSLW